MKRIYLLNALLVIMLASCSTQYKSTQTPDDLYYSPAPAASVAQQKKDEDKKDDKYQTYTSSEDQYLRMKVTNRSRWSSIDDYSYWYDTRYNDYSYNSNYNIGLSPYYGHSQCACNCYSNTSIFYPGYYNPYVSSFYSGYSSAYPYYGNVYYTPKVVHPNVVRPQLGGYLNTNYSNNTSTGNTIKKIFSTNSRSSNTGTYNSNERSYTPSSSSSSSSSGSSSSSSSSSSGTISRPGRH